MLSARIASVFASHCDPGDGRRTRERPERLTRRRSPLKTSASARAPPMLCSIRRRRSARASAKQALCGPSSWALLVATGTWSCPRRAVHGVGDLHRHRGGRPGRRDCQLLTGYYPGESGSSAHKALASVPSGRPQPLITWNTGKGAFDCSARCPPRRPREHGRYEAETQPRVPRFSIAHRNLPPLTPHPPPPRPASPPPPAPPRLHGCDLSAGLRRRAKVIILSAREPQTLLVSKPLTSLIPDLRE